MMKNILIVIMSLAYGHSYSQVQTIGNTTIEQNIIPGQTFTYSIKLVKGEYAKVIVNQIGIDLMIKVTTPASIVFGEFDSPNGANGEESVEIIAEETGMYQLYVKPFDEKQKEGKFTVALDKKLLFKEYTGKVIDWFSQNAIPVKSTEPDSNFSDLIPLKNVFKNVSIVGLGEATHGSHEIFTMKSRLIEFLVTQMNYRVVCIEGSISETKEINLYITGKTDIKPKNQYGVDATMWVDKTKEMDKLIEWMRKYNKSKPEKFKVQLFGIDPQVNSSPINYLENYFTKNCPEFKDTVKALFANLRKQDITALNFERIVVDMPEFHKLERMLIYLILNKAALSSKSSVDEYNQAFENLKLILYFLEFNADDQIIAGGSRDKYMAEIFEQIVCQFPNNTRFILWAHNGHISTKDYGFMAMGTYIRRNHKSKYFALGSAFNEGSFNAQVEDKKPYEVKKFTVPPSPIGSLEWLLMKTGKGNAFFNLRALATDTAVTEWLAQPQRMHSIGGLFSEKSTIGNYIAPFTLKRDFDGIMFFEKVMEAKTIK